MYDPQRLRPHRDSHDQKDRDVRNPHLLRQQTGERADRKDKPTRKQRVLGEFNRGRCFQLKLLESLVVRVTRMAWADQHEPARTFI